MSRKSSKSPDRRDASNAAKLRRPSRAREQINQLRFPATIRIAAGQEDDPPLPPAAALPKEHKELLDRVGKLLAGLATAIWRMHRRLTTENVVDEAARIRAAIRHAETAFDQARAGGLTMRDYVGEIYKPGLDGVRVLSHEADASPVDRIIQAQCPAVWLEGVVQPLQRAEVVVSDGPRAEEGGRPSGDAAGGSPTDNQLG